MRRFNRSRRKDDFPSGADVDGTFGLSEADALGDPALEKNALDLSLGHDDQIGAVHGGLEIRRRGRGAAAILHRCLEIARPFLHRSVEIVVARYASSPAEPMNASQSGLRSLRLVTLSGPPLP